MLKKVILTCLLASLLSLIGCGPDKVNIYQEEAYNRLKSACEEDIQYERYEKLNTGTYRFWYKSNVRDLHFYVDSYVENNTRVYSTNYHDVIANLYRDAIVSYLSDYVPGYDTNNNYIVVNDHETLGELAHALSVCEELYSVENQYHSYIYTDEFSPYTVKIVKNDLISFCEYDFSDYLYPGTKPENAILAELNILYEYSEGDTNEEIY